MNKHSIKQLYSFLLLWGSQTVSQLGTAMTDYAIIIWVYSQKGTASSVTLLTVCSFLPTIFLRFLAGSMVDRWNKKRIMLIADLLAACGTLAVFVLHSAKVLEIWHLYVINFLLSLMNAFQEPASFVAVSMLVPKEHYARAGGLQGFGGAAISILAPALGALLLAYGGLEMVLIVDLATFAIAFLVLLFLIRIPEVEKTETEEEPFSQTCLAGIRYLREHTAILRITLFLAVINFLAKLGNEAGTGRRGELYSPGCAGRKPDCDHDEAGKKADSADFYHYRPDLFREHHPEPDFPAVALVRGGLWQLSVCCGDECKYGYTDAGKGSAGNAGTGVFRKEHAAEFHDSNCSSAGRCAGR